MKLRFGDHLAPLGVETIEGANLALPHPDYRFTHLQFRRWIGCPICNLHVATFRRQAERIAAAKIREVMFFHSTADEIRSFKPDLPFDLVGDAERVHYRRFGVERGWRFIANWRVVRDGVRGLMAGKFRLADTHGIDGLPADFLVASNGFVVAANYGDDAADHWSVDELIATARMSENLHAKEISAAPQAR